MVRRLQTCTSCRGRFIANSISSTVSLCSKCIQPQLVSIDAVSTPNKAIRRDDPASCTESHSPATTDAEIISKTPRITQSQDIKYEKQYSKDVSEVTRSPDGISNPSVVDVLSDDEDDNDSRPERLNSDEQEDYSGGDDDDDDEDLPLSELISARSTSPSPSINGKENNVEHVAPSIHLSKQSEGKKNENLDVCNICGSSLVHISSWNGRLNHLKRCSQRHGVTAEQMREDDTAIEGDAPVQNSLPQKPKSINQLLMAGARRKAIQEKHKTQATKKARFGNGGGWKPRRTPSGACPDYKKIPGTDFIVDGFYYAKPSLSSNYFLTHFHSDHYGGLTKSWSAGIIYCSSVTANLVQQQLGVQRQFLHVLPMNQTMMLETRSGRKVKVTLIDANHCPGAVIFFFQVGEQTILHVGDFRWNREQHLAPVHSLLQGRRLDKIYLDTTYCDPKYTLPTQQDAIAATVRYAVAQVQDATRKRQRLLLLFGAYTIGKERIYLAVAKALQMKVYVDSRRYRILQALEWPEDQRNLLTTRSDETMLWVVPLGHINMKRLPSYTIVKIGRQEHTFDRVIGMRPTGWSLKGTKSKTRKAVDDSDLLTFCNRGNLTTCSVPYSEHSAFPELVDCLACLQPRIIVPTVSVRKSQEQINILLEHLEQR